MPQASSLLPGMRNLSPDAKKLGASDVKPSWKTLSRILKYAGNQKRYIVYVMTAAVIGCTFDVFAPYFMGRIIDMMTGKGEVRFENVLKAGGVLLSFYLLSAGLQWNSTTSQSDRVRTAAELRREGFDRIAGWPLFFLTDMHGTSYPVCKRS
jgi:ABC-type multidrug transport system fused ATPase/permease subunit